MGEKKIGISMWKPSIRSGVVSGLVLRRDFFLGFSTGISVSSKMNHTYLWIFGWVYYQVGLFRVSS